MFWSGTKETWRTKARPWLLEQKKGSSEEEQQISLHPLRNEDDAGSREQRGVLDVKRGTGNRLGA